MKRGICRGLSHCIIILLLLSGISSLASAAPKYYATEIDIGNVGPANIGFTGFNSSGELVGHYYWHDAHDNYGGFYFDTNSNAFLDMGNLGGKIYSGGGLYTIPNNINSSGTVVGTSGAPDGFKPFAWNKYTGITSIPNPNPNANKNPCTAYNVNAINDEDQIVGNYSLYTPGYYASYGCAPHAFISGGSLGFADIGTINNNQYSDSNGVALNNSGAVIGNSTVWWQTSHPFIWDNANGIKDLTSIAGQYFSPTSINNSGQILGSGSVNTAANNTFSTFAVWDATNGLQVVPEGPGFGWYQQATGMNDLGQVIGYSYAGSAWSYSPNIQLAFIWDKINGVQKLNDLIPADSGWVLQKPHVINNINQIAGTGTLNGNSEAFLLKPIPPQNQAPSQPEQTLPANNSFGLDARNIQLNWNQSIASDSGTVQYCVDIYEVKGSGNLPVFMGCEGMFFADTTSYSPAVSLEAGKTYQWAVWAKDSQGNLSESSVWWTFSTASAVGATIYVPDGSPSIQAAINAANDGDTIVIRDGVYTGTGNFNLDFLGKAITVKSQNGPSNCIIDCQQKGMGVSFHSGEGGGSVLSGITIKNGLSQGAVEWGIGYKDVGIYIENSSPVITGCILTGNSTGHTVGALGGVIYLIDSNANIRSCNIDNNMAYGIVAHNSAPIITNCDISNNYGGIYTDNSFLYVAKCSLNNNAVNGLITTYSSNDGPPYWPQHFTTVASSSISGNGGGGLSISDSGWTIISNCVITGNKNYGITGSNCRIQNSTICYNNGDGITANYGLYFVINSIIRSNTQNQIYVEPATSISPDPIKPNVLFSNIQGGWPDLGNIDVDPMFVDPANGNYRLKASSLCINAGSNFNYFKPMVPMDMDGSPRILAGTVDMGAYEYKDIPFPLNPSINNGTITFGWDAVNGAVSYEIQVDEDSGFNSPEIYDTYSGTLSAPYTNFLPDGTYYVRVRAKMPDGSFTIWSPPLQFNFSLLPGSADPVWVPLYRLYNTSIHDHFYTTISSQRDTAITQGYKFEKIECYVSDRKFSDANVGYLFRLDWTDPANSSNVSHFYTSSVSERNQMIQKSYKFMGIVGFLYTNPTLGYFPLYHLERPDQTDHFYTISKYEYDNATNSTNQFTDQGVVGYVSPAGLKAPIVHNRPQGRFSDIDTATGAFRPSFTDLKLTGVGPSLEFTRYYDSINSSEVPMGPGWSHSLYSYATEAPSRDVMVKWGDGTESYFKANGASAFDPDPGNFDTLTRVNDGVNTGYNLVRKDQNIYWFRQLSIQTLPSAYFVPSIFLVHMEDRNGNKLDFSYYASNGALYQVRDSSGRTFSLDYDQGLRLTKVTDNSINRSVSFSYDQNGFLSTFTDARGNITTYGYSQFGNKTLLSSITYPRGNTVTLQYDNQQRIATYTAGTVNGDKITLAVGFDQTQCGTTQISSQGWSRTYSHDPYPNCRVTGIFDINGNAINIDYPAEPNLVNLPSKIADNRRLDNPLSFTYKNDPANGNLLQKTDILGETTQYTYDGKNNLTSVTDPRGYTTFYDYDSNEVNLLKIRLPMGGESDFTYDSRGLVTTSKDPNAHLFAYTYDGNGNLTRQDDTSLGTSIVFAPDAAGRMTSRTDELNRVTTTHFDANDNPYEVIDPDGKTASFIYDPNNKLSTVKDFRSKSSGYTYDSMDLLASEADPVGATYQYFYDGRGNLSTVGDPEGHITSYSYDSNNRLQTINYDNVPRVTLSYFNDGTLSSMTDDSGTSSFAYDALKRVTSHTDGFGKTVSYHYDASGNRDQIGYPDGKKVTYLFDGENRLQEVTDWLSGQTIYTYDLAGILQQAVNPNGTKAIFSHDAANRLTGLSNRRSTSSIISEYAFTLDTFGNHTGVAKTEPLTPTYSTAQIAYSYDDANRLISSGGVSFTYDNRGNLTSGSNGNAFAYDYANRLISATVAGGTTTYTYDGFGNRVARSKNGSQTRYVLDINGPMSQVLAETDQSGNITAYYIYGLGLISRITPDGRRYTYHYDSLGNTIAITDSSQTIVNEYAYDEFGQVLASSEAFPNPFRYVGQYGVMDEGNGLLLMRARYYDTATGRFINKDPLGFGGGDLNLYAYRGGNPVMGVDPNGLSAQESGGQKISLKSPAEVLIILSQEMSIRALKLYNLTIGLPETLLEGSVVQYMRRRGSLQGEVPNVRFFQELGQLPFGEEIFSAPIASSY